MICCARKRRTRPALGRCTFLPPDGRGSLADVAKEGRGEESLLTIFPGDVIQVLVIRAADGLLQLPQDGHGGDEGPRDFSKPVPRAELPHEEGDGGDEGHQLEQQARRARARRRVGGAAADRERSGHLFPSVSVSSPVAFAMPQFLRPVPSNRPLDRRLGSLARSAAFWALRCGLCNVVQGSATRGTRGFNSGSGNRLAVSKAHV